MSDPTQPQRRAAAKLRWCAAFLAKWQVKQCHHISRHDNTKLFEVEQTLRQIAKKVRQNTP